MKTPIFKHSADGRHCCDMHLSHHWGLGSPVCDLVEDIFTEEASNTSEYQKTGSQHVAPRDPTLLVISGIRGMWALNLVYLVTFFAVYNRAQLRLCVSFVHSLFVADTQVKWMSWLLRQ